MRKNGILIFIILSLFFKVSFGQEQLNNDLLSPEELIADFDYMLITLEETHPNLYAYVPKEEFVKKTDVFRKSINKPMSLAEFYKILYKTIALIRQGHTMVFGDAGFSDFKDGGGLSFPLKITYFLDHIYIDQNFCSNKELTRGTELIAINRIPVTKIIENFTSYLVVRPNGYIAKTLSYNWSKLLWL